MKIDEGSYGEVFFKPGSGIYKSFTPGRALQLHNDDDIQFDADEDNKTMI